MNSSGQQKLVGQSRQLQAANKNKKAYQTTKFLLLKDKFGKMRESNGKISDLVVELYTRIFLCNRNSREICPR